MRKLLFRSRSGEGYPMVIAVTLCLLMLFMVISHGYALDRSWTSRWDSSRFRRA